MVEDDSVGRAEGSTAEPGSTEVAVVVVAAVASSPPGPAGGVGVTVDIFVSGRSSVFWDDEDEADDAVGAAAAAVDNEGGARKGVAVVDDIAPSTAEAVGEVALDA